MKRLFALLLTILMLSCSVLCTSAKETTASKTKTTIEYLESGYYIETVITWEESNTRTTKPGTKTSTLYNNNDEALCSIKVTATFSYNGTTCTCTSAYHTATSYSSAVTMSNASSSKSGNSATAKATATITAGFVSVDKNLSVTLTCSPTGVFS